MKYFYEVRQSFWDMHPEFKSEYRKTWRQNQYNATIRASFVMYVDHLEREGTITRELANRVTL